MAKTDGSTVLSDDQFAAETNTWRGGYAGASRNVHTGAQAKIGSPGYLVGVVGHEVKKAGPARTSDVTTHRAKMLADPAVSSDEAAHQGSWHVGPEGAAPVPEESVTYDHSRRVLGKQFAIRLGRRENQKAIFDLKKGDDVELPAGRMARALEVDNAAASARLDKVYAPVLLRGKR